MLWTWSNRQKAKVEQPGDYTVDVNVSRSSDRRDIAILTFSCRMILRTPLFKPTLALTRSTLYLGLVQRWKCDQPKPIGTFNIGCWKMVNIPSSSQ